MVAHMKRLFVMVALLPGCRGDDCCTQSHPDAAADGGVRPDPSLTEVALVPSAVNHDLDLLFVIDDSSGMYDKQERLRQALPQLIQVLAHGVLPNLHIGVITTDMGTSATLDAQPGVALATCAGFGKDGELQTFGAPVADKYLSNTANADGSRLSNYTGALNDALVQMMTPGQNGCGIEQPLQAIKRSFENPANAGFLRENARLGVVLLSDEDDCSMAHSSLLSDPSLGQIVSFRCTTYGVTCDQGGATAVEMNTFGDKAGCHGNRNPDYVADVETYTSFLSLLKPDPRDLFFQAIVGTPDPFTIIPYTTTADVTVPLLAASCVFSGTSGPSEALPPARIAQLAGSLRRGQLESVCDSYFPGVMTRLGERLKNLTGGSCLELRIATPARCEAFDMIGTELVPLPACSDSLSTDCYKIVQDPAACPAGQQLALQIARSQPASADTWTSLRCAI
jgi:hypothetical protein